MAEHDFHPVIINKNNMFCVYLPEWNLSGEGKTLEQAYQEFEGQKKAFLSRSEKYSLATISPEPYPTLKRAKLYHELVLFFIKVATAAFAIIFVGILLLPHIGAAVRNQILPSLDNPLNRIVIDLPTKINERLDRITPEEKEKIKEQWEKLFKRTAPVREMIDASFGDQKKTKGSK